MMDANLGTAARARLGNSRSLNFPQVSRAKAAKLRNSKLSDEVRRVSQCPKSGKDVASCLTRVP
jgi:hypothetical protein